MDGEAGRATGAGHSSYDGDFGASMDASMKGTVNDTREAIGILQEVARRCNAKETLATLDTIDGRSRDLEFRLLVCGHFNAGKSTLLNALFGKFEAPIDGLSESGVLPVGRFPTTAVQTDVVYGHEPAVRVWKKDETREDWSFKRFLDAGRLKASERETKKMFEPIRQFEVELPVPMLKANVRISDSPGMGDHEDRDAITRETLLISDAAISVFRGEMAGNKVEREFAREVEESGCRTFRVVNLSLSQQSPEEEEVREFWWNRLVGERNGPVPTMAEFHARDIYFVDAKMASDGRVRGDMAAVRGSGLLELEAVIIHFLLNDKFHAHANKAIRETDRAAEGLSRTLRTRQKALRMSAEELDRNLKNLEPQLRIIEQEERTLRTILSGHEQSFVLAGQGSFREFVDSLLARLEPKLAEERMETLRGVAGFLKALHGAGREAIADEFVEICKRLIGSEVKEWTRAKPPAPGLQAALAPELEQVTAAITAQIGRIDSARDILHGSLDLDGSQVSKGMGSGLVSQIGTQIGATVGGRAAVGGAIGAAISTALVATIGGKIALMLMVFIATTFGVLINPLLLLAAIGAAVTGVAMTTPLLFLEGKVKKGGLESVSHQLGSSAQAFAAIEESLRGIFRDLANPTVELVSKAIAADREAIQELRAAREGERSVNAGAALAIEGEFERIDEAREKLGEASNALRQIG